MWEPYNGMVSQMMWRKGTRLWNGNYIIGVWNQIVRVGNQMIGVWETNDWNVGTK